MSRTLSQLVTASATVGVFATNTALQSVVSNVDPEALDSLTEVVGAFQAADSSLNGAITDLATANGSRMNTIEAAHSSLVTQIGSQDTANAAHFAAVESDIEDITTILDTVVPA